MIADTKIQELVAVALREHHDSTPTPEQVEAANNARWRELRFWPEGKPLPWRDGKGKEIPCPECRRVRMDDLGLACARIMTFEGIVILRCKCCGTKFEIAREGFEEEPSLEVAAG